MGSIRPLSYDAQTSHAYTDAGYRTLLKHEFVHYYLEAITSQHVPSWLNEGLAMVLSEDPNDLQTAKLEAEKKKKLGLPTSTPAGKFYTRNKAFVKDFIGRRGSPALVGFLNTLHPDNAKKAESSSETGRMSFAQYFEHYFGEPAPNTKDDRIESIP